MLRDSLASVRAAKAAYHQSKPAQTARAVVGAGRPSNNDLVGGTRRPYQNGSNPVGNCVTVQTLKITIPIKPSDLPATLVPAEPLPTGNPVLNVQLQGTDVVVPVFLSGKNARKTLKTVAQHGAENVNLVINGVLKPGALGGWVVDSASFQVFVKSAPTEAAPVSNSINPPQ
jgi:hypothetical protein